MAHVALLAALFTGAAAGAAGAAAAVVENALYPYGIRQRKNGKTLLTK